MKFRVVLHGFKTFAVICRLSVNDVAGYTVFIIFRFDETFSQDRNKKVMRLQRWHLPLDHLVEEH